MALVIDGDRSEEGGPGGPAILLPRDLGLPSAEWEQMAGIYSVLELATAMKPSLLRHLLAPVASDQYGNPAVLYLDPDIMVYHPFPEVFEAARRSGIALTPHVLHPLPRDGLEPNERCLMHSGLFNLGFLGVGSGSAAFLDWWHERLRLDAVIDFPNALFTDQRWVDWVPSLFGGEVLRDHGLNVAYWNLHERPLARGGDGRIRAAGEPLKFFHFSGYEPDRPLTLSKHAAGHPRCALGDDPLVGRLCSDYVEALATAGFDETRHIPYGLACAPNGLVLTPDVRSAYSSGILAALASGATLPPSPFVAGGDAFCAWLDQAPEAQQLQVDQLGCARPVRPSVGTAIASAAPRPRVAQVRNRQPGVLDGTRQSTLLGLRRGTRCRHPVVGAYVIASLRHRRDRH